jgi:hypothetical protein
VDYLQAGATAGVRGRGEKTDICVDYIRWGKFVGDVPASGAIIEVGSSRRGSHVQTSVTPLPKERLRAAPRPGAVDGAQRRSFTLDGEDRRGSVFEEGTGRCSQNETTIRSGIFSK